VVQRTAGTSLLCAKVPGTIKMIVHGAGHLLNMEKQKEFNQLVLNFLESLVPRGSII
jgi:pimeloyl-ACP methyl ester carboxylesterase